MAREASVESQALFLSSYKVLDLVSLLFQCRWDRSLEQPTEIYCWRGQRYV